MGISRKMKDKDWTDSQGRKGKGFGVYRFADKYGVRRRKNLLLFSPRSCFSGGFFSPSRRAPLPSPSLPHAPPPPPPKKKKKNGPSHAHPRAGQRRRLLPDLHARHLVRVGRLVQARHQGPRRVGGPDRGPARRRRQPDHLDQPDRLLGFRLDPSPSRLALPLVGTMGGRGKEMGGFVFLKQIKKKEKRFFIVGPEMERI